VIEECFGVIEPLLGTKTACAAVGRSRATHYRRARPGRVTERKPRPAPADKLTEAEVDAVLAALLSERFVDCSPDQVYFTLLDEGTYYEASQHPYGLTSTYADQRMHVSYAAYAEVDHSVTTV
jgi:putative transposase